MKMMCMIFGHKLRYTQFEDRGIAAPSKCSRCGHENLGVEWPRSSKGGLVPIDPIAHFSLENENRNLRKRMADIKKTVLDICTHAQASYLSHALRWDNMPPRGDPAVTFSPLLLFGTETIEEVDRELAAIVKDLRQRTIRAREIAKKARKQGNDKKWEKYNAIARAWEMAAEKIGAIGCPF